MVVLLITAVLGGLLVLGMASAMMGGGTSRTLTRTSALLLLDEVGEAAIAEAVGHVRQSLDAGRASPPATRDDWRTIVLDGRRSEQVVVPVRLRELLRARLPDVVVPDVRVKVSSTWPGSQVAGGPPRSPQGTLEFAVAMFGGGGLMSALRRTVRQRRVFYVSPGRPGSPDVVTLLAAPLATVME